MLNGIDISGWQEGLDLSQVPCDFVIIKGTGGNGYVSSTCDGFVQQAIALGKPYGVYHFAREVGFADSAINEARWFVDNCRNYFDGNGSAVKGMVNINGQNLLFDNNGKQIKGHLVRVNGVVRYFDPNSGEMAVNRWVEVSPGWWVYFDGEGRGQI